MMDRREVLQAGCSSFLGLGLSGLLQQRAVAAASESRAKSVVLVFLSGGGSHIDMFDPKPTASETKGEFEPIATKVPGLHFSEMMPMMAERADRFTVVRSMSHTDNRHLSGSHNTLTGSIQPFRGESNQDKSLNRADWPCYGAAIESLRPPADGSPSQVTIPVPLIEGPLVWPGQHAGFLGSKYDPFQVNSDPNEQSFAVRGLTLTDGLSVGRLDRRWQLLNSAIEREKSLDSSHHTHQFADNQEAAFSLLTSSKLSEAFEIDQESPEMRERYGRSRMGQTLLLARRLVEAEVPVVQCNMGHVQIWDTHVNHFPRLKNDLLPPLDRGVSVLLDDLSERGLLDQTLVIVVGEFGRTPQISPLAGEQVPGRHHWAPAYSAVFAGAGVRGGQVIGATDDIGAYPITKSYHPNDLGATVYQSLGIDPHTMVRDRLGRPIPLNQGKVMDVLFG
ncbi:MAG: DUF1501 domain-containing protein [Planctomycetaceae bacterium]|nr:DUF1501 domain-containing protein [Planctomycetaceae bacterium]